MDDETDEKKQALVEQASRSQKMWAAVVLAAIDDAIKDDRKYGNGPEQMRRWACSRDGREVLSNSGIEHSSRVVDGLVAYVTKGIPTSTGLNQNSKSTA